MPRHCISRQTSENAIGFCVGCLLLSMRFVLISGLCPQRDSIGENEILLCGELTS